MIRIAQDVEKKIHRVITRLKITGSREKKPNVDQNVSNFGTVCVDPAKLR